MKVWNQFLHSVMFTGLILVTPITFAQRNTLHEEYAGYDECHSSSNPMSCLKNMLASINSDAGFYEELSISKMHTVKSEYNFQIALLYAEQGKLELSMRYTNEALMHIESAINATDEDKLDYYPIKSEILLHGKAICKQLNNQELWEACNCSKFDIADQFYADLQAELNGTTTQETNTEVKEAKEVVTTNENNQESKGEAVHTGEVLYRDLVLEAMRKHMKSKPLKQGFTSKALSDTCILKIDHYMERQYMVKECFVVQSSHLHDCGERLMRIANLIEFENLVDPVSFEIPIVIRPGTETQCFYDNGLFYIEYPYVIVGEE